MRINLSVLSQTEYIQILCKTTKVTLFMMTTKMALIIGVCCTYIYIYLLHHLYNVDIKKIV